MSMLVAMAWRNLWRHGRRSVLTALAMAIGMSMSMALISLYDGMFGLMRTLMVDRMIGHVQIVHPDFPTKRGLYDTLPDGDELLRVIDGLPQSRGSVARVHGQALLGTHRRSSGVRLIGVLPDREALVTDLPAIVPSTLPGGVAPGRFLSSEAAREVVLGADLARDLEVGLGDEVVAVTQDALGGIGNEVYRVVGLSRSGDDSMDRAGAWLHLRDLQDLLAIEQQVHELRVLAGRDDEATVQPLVRAIEREISAAQPDTQATVSPWWDVDPIAAQLFEMRGVSQFIVLFVVFGLVAVGVINTMLMSVFERTRELGVIQALGLRPRGIIALVVIEAFLLGGVAIAMGLVMGGALVGYLLTAGIDFAVGEGEGFGFGGVVFPPRMHGGLSVDVFIQPTIGVLLSALIAALLPALRAARLRPVDAIRGE
jgi:putative ABC transport system permease protein